MGEIGYEPDGVHQHQGASARQRHPPQGRVEGREELVGRMHSGSRQAVEEGGLAGVRVADERDHRHPGAPAGTAVDRAPTLDGVELPPDPLDALADEAPVGLELRLARTAQADPAALALEMGPPANQPGRQVAKLRELHLQPAFEGARAPRENVEDETDPVEHPALEQRLEIPLLGRRQTVVEDDELDCVRLHPRPKLLRLAGPHEVPRIAPARGGDDQLRRVRPGCADQLDELLRGAFGVLPANPRVHEQRAGPGGGPLEQIRDPALHPASRAAARPRRRWPDERVAVRSMAPPPRSLREGARFAPARWRRSRACRSSGSPSS